MADYSAIGTAFVLVTGVLALATTLLIAIIVVPDERPKELDSD